MASNIVAAATCPRTNRPLTSSSALAVDGPLTGRIGVLHELDSCEQHRTRRHAPEVADLLLGIAALSCAHLPTRLHDHITQVSRDLAHVRSVQVDRRRVVSAILLAFATHP